MTRVADNVRHGPAGAVVAKPLVLTSDLIRFCHGGVDIILASCEADGSPVGGLALGCRIDERNHSVRLILQRKPNAALLRAIELGKAIAATFSQPTTHRSIQLKAPGGKIGPVKPDEKQLAADQSAAFARELIAIGYPEVFSHTFVAHDPRDLCTITFTPTEAFQQTPGPNAGSAL